MAKTKTAAQSAKKWARVTPARSEDYAEGVATTDQDWATNTAAAEDRYKAGIQKAVSRGAFGKGVKAAGQDKWKKNTLEKGTRRWGEGVQAAEQNYQIGFEPYAAVIASTTLPPKYPKGDPRNLERTRVMNEALRKKKESLT